MSLSNFRRRIARLAAQVIACVALHNLAGANALAVQDRLGEARRLFLTGKYAEADEAFEELSGEKPAEAAIGRARCDVARGKYETALEILKTADKDRPQAGSIEAELARICFERGEY